MQKIHEGLKKITESKVLFRVLFMIGIVIVVMLIFSAGVIVGFRKASFGQAWGEHYNENFGMGRMSGIGMINNFPNAHGATGKIIKLELPNIIVQDKDSVEKVIVIDDDTNIQKGRDNIQTTDLKIDDFVIVIGTPNEQGQIEAKLMRVIPSPEFLK